MGVTVYDVNDNANENIQTCSPKSGLFISINSPDWVGQVCNSIKHLTLLLCYLKILYFKNIRRKVGIVSIKNKQILNYNQQSGYVSLQNEYLFLDSVKNFISKCTYKAHCSFWKLHNQTWIFLWVHCFNDNQLLVKTSLKWLSDHKRSPGMQ